MSPVSLVSCTTYETEELERAIRRAVGLLGGIRSFVSPRQPILAVSFGVSYFGRTSEPKPPRRSSGFLLLLSDRVFYRSRIAGLELEIPGRRITRIYHGTGHKGVDLHQSLMKLDFVNEIGEPDTAAFRVPYPPQWMQAIQNRFRTGKSADG